MKKTFVLLMSFVGFQFTSKAQSLTIINSRGCPIYIDVFANGPCLGTGTCSFPVGGIAKLRIPNGTWTFNTIMDVNISPMTITPFSTAGTCGPGTYEYQGAGIQNSHECKCPGVGITVADPCICPTGAGPTAYAGSGSGDCPDRTYTAKIEWLTPGPGTPPGSAVIYAY